MPYYEVNHSYPLTAAQQDNLAAAITQIHCRLFTVPTLFAHVRFNDTSSKAIYLGGKRRRTNLIFANMRAGPGRTREQQTDLCSQLSQAWEATIKLGRQSDEQPEHAGTEDGKLHAIFVMGVISAGWEAGSMAPELGKGKEWLVEKLPELEREAAQGDEDAAAMLEELRTRDDFKAILGM